MRVAVVGAGIAGLLAARDLADRGHAVTVHEAAPQPGGRLATHAVSVASAAAADSGAQFLTVRTERFGALVAALVAEGVVHEWCRGFGPEPDGYPRYAATGGMGALAVRLARGLELHTRSAVTDLRALDADAVVLTPPLPATAAILAASGIDVPGAVAAVRYEPTIAVLVALQGPAPVPAPGGLQAPRPPFSFVADNEAKGASPLPCLTLHLDAPTSVALSAAPDDEVAATAIDAAAEWVGGADNVTGWRVVRWPHATPTPVLPDPALEVAPGVVLAGDAFDGPKVEGAATSGWAAVALLSG